jgi:hypothetical protein
MAEAPVVIYPPLDGRRRVQIRGERVGVAVGITDVLEFLRRAGLDLDAVDLGTRRSSSGAAAAPTTGDRCPGAGSPAPGRRGRRRGGGRGRARLLTGPDTHC